MDAFHTLAATRLIEAVADNNNLIPFTWALCRLCNALLTIIGVSIFLTRKYKNFQGNFGFVVAISFGFGIFSYGIIYLCAISNVLPETMFPDSIITRPWDVLPLILFVGAGILIYPRFYNQYPSLFSHALIISTIPDAATQLHMAFGSTALFDNHFNIAHFLKIIAYLVPLAGLILDYTYTHRQLEETNKNFLLEITERQKVETKLREFDKRENLLRSRIYSQIGSSLDVTIILKTATDEIYDLLQLDRCNFSWYHPLTSPPSWETVWETKHSHLNSLIGLHNAPTIEFSEKKLLSQKILQVDNIQTLEQKESQFKDLLLSWGLTCVLAQSIRTKSGKIGILICDRSQRRPPRDRSANPFEEYDTNKLRHWNPEEVKLIQDVGEQLAIALNQSQLYTEACQNAENAQIAFDKLQHKTQELENTITELQSTQLRLIQSEKMSSLGQMIAGIAHEINNPVSFVHGNLFPACDYASDLLDIIELYQKNYPSPSKEVQELIEAVELDFLKIDFIRLLDSMKIGTERIREIVVSLRNFSRLDEAEFKEADIHEGINNTLMILHSRLKGKSTYPEIEVIKEYGHLPLVECYAGQLNQVFMNILTNAIDALDEYNARRTIEDVKTDPSKIKISTKLDGDEWVEIRIANNGSGIPEEVQSKLFDPFFTTKEIGKGTGIGLSISYQIVVDKHQGKLSCQSVLEEGTEFIIHIPVHQVITED
ncbi:MAG: ATP-binding protein, partial [Cyanobacteria bacterium P01_A01_bin.84]